MLTHFEVTRLISARALQIAMGAPVLVKLNAKDTNPYSIAEKEFESKKLPLIVIRKMPDGEEINFNLKGEIIGETKK